MYCCTARQDVWLLAVLKDVVLMGLVLPAPRAVPQPRVRYSAPPTPDYDAVSGARSQSDNRELTLYSVANPRSLAACLAGSLAGLLKCISSSKPRYLFSPAQRHLGVSITSSIVEALLMAKAALVAVGAPASLTPEPLPDAPGVLFVGLIPMWVPGPYRT